MKEIVLGSAKIAVDETRAPVLDPGPGPHQDRLLLVVVNVNAVFLLLSGSEFD